MVVWRRNFRVTICRLVLSGVVSGWRWDTEIISTIFSLKLFGSLDKSTFFCLFFVLQYQPIWDKKKKKSLIKRDFKSSDTNGEGDDSPNYVLPLPSTLHSLKGSNGTKQSWLFCFVSLILFHPNNTAHAETMSRDLQDKGPSSASCLFRQYPTAELLADLPGLSGSCGNYSASLGKIWSSPFAAWDGALGC